MLINKIISYESGELEENEILELFAELIKTKYCWSLQGHYGRMAERLIDNGYISKEGEILI
jgi:hypothetical protein